MARGRKHEFTRCELFYIQHHCTKMSAEDLSKELGINLPQIEEKVAEFKKTKLPNAYDMMVKESDKRKHKVAVMTQGASQIGDHNRKVTTPTRMGECVHVINEDRE